MRAPRALLAVIVGLSFSACAHTPPAPQGELKPGTAWVAYSPEWKEEAEAVYADATRYVDLVAEEKAGERWGVVLDLDETVLNNVAYQMSIEYSGAGYNEKTWYAWTQKQAATLVPGAAEFIRHVNDAGGHIAFVTNRLDTEQYATEGNLQKLGLKRHDDFRVFLTQGSPRTGKGDGSLRDKGLRFALVPDMLTAQGYQNVEIVAYVGDGKGDHPATEGSWRFFCIDQGAMYGDYCATTPRSGQ